MSEYTQKVITIGGTSYRTDVTLADVAKAAEGLEDGLDALENCRVARFNEDGTAYATADLGEEVCGYLTHQDSELTARTSRGQQFIGKNYTMHVWPSSTEGNSPHRANLYVEKSVADRLFPPTPILGRAIEPMKLADYLAAGNTLEDGKRYKFSLRHKVGFREEISGVRESERTETKGVYWGTVSGRVLLVYSRVDFWSIANTVTGETYGFIGLEGTSGHSSSTLHETWIEGVDLEEAYEEYLPLSALTREELKALGNSITPGTILPLYVDLESGGKAKVSVVFDEDAPGNGFRRQMDFAGHGYPSIVGMAALCRDHILFNTFRKSIYLDAKTVKEYLPSLYHEAKSPEPLEVGNLVLTPQGETLEIVEMTESFIIAKGYAVKDEPARALALPISQAETLKVLDVSKAL
ncbi:MAG: hypothetical protein EOM68_20770 [Spirochaetia bacterium]|nr:hypothetical protein [Spirochaetia bacterium]